MMSGQHILCYAIFIIHCSKYYQGGDGLTLDVGPFMKALEVLFMCRLSLYHSLFIDTFIN